MNFHRRRARALGGAVGRALAGALVGSVTCSLPCGCGGARQSGIETRVEAGAADLTERLRAGFAFAPALVTGNRTDAVPLGATLTRMLYEQVCTDAFLALGDVAIVAPEQVRAALADGAQAEALSALRRRRAAGEPVDPQGAQTIAAATGASLLWITWLDERDERGSQLLLTEITDAPWPADGGTIPYTQVRGELWGELIDLRGAAPAWRGVAAYRTGRGTPARIRSQLPGLRSQAAGALSRLLLAP